MIQPRNNFTQSDEFKKAVFFIDDISENRKGFTCGQYWNGWECPYFEKEESADIINSVLGYRGSAHFDESEDSFHVQLEEGDEPEIFKGLDIVVISEIKHVYPIGAFSWCWMKNNISDKQKELLKQLGKIYIELSEECLNDTVFADVMTDNNDLFPMSLDELGHEFLSLSDGERNK